MGVGWCFWGGLCCDIASLVVCLEPGFIGVGVADEGERDGVVVRVCVDHGHVRGGGVLATECGRSGQDVPVIFIRIIFKTLSW